MGEAVVRVALVEFLDQGEQQCHRGKHANNRYDGDDALASQVSVQKRHGSSAREALVSMSARIAS